MSESIIVAAGTGRASPPRLPVRSSLVTAAGARSVPMYTRHMRGAIEAERDRRERSHNARVRRHVSRRGAPHPRLAAAIAAGVSSATQLRGDENRWADDGGWFDREAVGRLQIANRKMKRCNS